MTMAGKDPSNITPTAHYTSYVWFRHGLSHPSLATNKGRLFYHSMRAFNAVSWAVVGGITLEAFLLQRHQIIDYLLGQAIEQGRVGQVLEVAAGLSPRGLRMSQKYRAKGLCYIEADLPEMAAQKKDILEKTGEKGDRHEVVTVNALSDDGPDSLFAIADQYLDPDVGTAIITEGLVNYFDKDVVSGIWKRFGKILSDRSGGVYLSDITMLTEFPTHPLSKVFRRTLNRMTRGQDHIEYFDGPEQATVSLSEAGFTRVSAHLPTSFTDRLDIPSIRQGDVIRVIEASL